MKRILVVDDDVACRQATTLILQQQFECAVDTAADCGALLERIHCTMPDAVLVSLNIPAMAGSALIQACQQDPMCVGVPIVVMAVTPRAAVEAIRMGARGCIRKPVDSSGVVSALQPLLSSPEIRNGDIDGAPPVRKITGPLTISCHQPMRRTGRGGRYKAERPRQAASK
jgi:DNA-binding NtrC family response regulator